MAKTVICQILPTEGGKWNGKNSQAGASKIVILEIYSAAAGNSRQLVLAKPYRVNLSFGDRIKCVSGAAAVLVNPSTQAGAFILTQQIPYGAAWNHRTEIELNDETTKILHRGKVSTTGDIGSINHGGGYSIR